MPGACSFQYASLGAGVGVFARIVSEFSNYIIRCGAMCIAIDHLCLRADGAYIIFLALLQFASVMIALVVECCEAFYGQILLGLQRYGRECIAFLLMVCVATIRLCLLSTAACKL